MSRLLCVALMGLVCVGCASTSTMGLARTLNKGAVQGWVALEGGGIVVPAASTGTSTGTGTGYPMAEGGVRFGASDHVELGARLGFNGLGLEGKFALARSPTMDQGLNVSINPQIGFFGVSAAGLFVGNLSMQLPVLIGIDFGGHELIFGPKLHNQTFFGSVTDASGATSGVALNLLSGGLSVGFAIKAGPVRVIPEVSGIAPFLASGAINSGGISSAVGVGGFIFQAGVGLLFGSRDAYERAQPVPPPEYTPQPQPMPYPVQPLPPASPEPVGAPEPVETTPPPPPPPVP